MKLDLHQFRKAIPSEEFDYSLLTSVLSSYKGIRQKINELLKAKVIIRIKKGLYVFGPNYTRNPICKEVLANLIYGPSYISLEYALSYHGLIPERVETVTSVTLNRYKDFRTPLGQFTYHPIARAKYPHEIQWITIDQTHNAFMASPAKALCDYLYLRRVEGIDSVKRAQEFLQNDLRIDQSHWKKLDTVQLGHLRQIYKIDAIAWIREAIQ